MDNKLLINFLHDTATFLDRLGSQLLQLEREPDNAEILEQCFRSAHSLKSEASYMDYEGMTQAAHRLESQLEQLRSGHEKLSMEMLEDMLGLVDTLKKQKQVLEAAVSESERLHKESDVVDVSPEGDLEEKLQEVSEVMAEEDLEEVAVEVLEEISGESVEPPASDSELDVSPGDPIFEAAELPDSISGPRVTPVLDEASVADVSADRLMTVPVEPVFTLNDFQKSVLSESRKRGELFYRLICEIDSEQPMKYAKAYLVVNNLELIVNVVNVYPSMEDVEADFSELNILFTSAVSEGEIFRAVNVDQVSRIQLAGLRYEDALGGGKGQSPVLTLETVPEGGEVSTPQENSGSREVRIDRSSLDEMGTYLEELRFLFHENPDCRDAGLELVNSMDRILSDIRMLPAGELFGGFARLVRDMAKKAGKEIHFEVDGSDVPMDRRLAQMLIEPLTHLIRNSIDHGIEPPADREGLGKNPRGQIELKVEQRGREILVILSDDGQGIKRADVLKRAGAMGIYTGEEKELLHYLVQPGFSTMREATPLSGRGMGLDLIQRTVRQNAGGKLSMITREGAGTSFIILLPREYNPVKLVLFKAGGSVFAASTREKGEIHNVEAGDFTKDSSGGLFLEGIPVYSVNGRLFMTGQAPPEKVVLKINHLGREAWLLIQEILFEQDLSEDQFRLGREVAPHHFEVFSGERKADYTYLNPSLFVS